MLFRKAVCMLLATVTVLCALPLSAQALEDKDISAPAAVLMDASLGRVLYAKNEHEKRPCASITKVMTLTLVMEALDSGKIKLTDIVTASEHAASMGGSDIWLEPGERMTVDDMIKATVVASANDAAVALAEMISGSEDEFVRKMNEKAKSLGMKETVFKNCNGLDEEGHITSAYDVALMSRELIKHRKIFDYSGIWMDHLRGGKTQLVNTNKLLKSYNGITGLKTGTTSAAGSCITATAERDGLSLIAVVLGSETGKQRFKDASALLDYGFANYAMYTPRTPQQAFTKIPVTGGMKSEIETTAKINDIILTKKGGEKDIKCKVNLPKSIAASVKKGDKVGEIVYSDSSGVLRKYPITTAEDVVEINMGDVFNLLLRAIAA